MQILLASWAALGLLASPPASTDYTVIDLGALPGGEQAWAFGLNHAGQVATTAQYDYPRRFSHAALWDNGTLTDLGQLTTSGFQSSARAVNQVGLVVGVSEAPGGFGGPADHAFLHDGVAMIDLGTLAGGFSSVANDINDVGDIVGFSDTDVVFSFRRVSHAVLWTGGNTVDLGTLGGLYSRANAVNQWLQIVGTSMIDSGPFHAFAWSPRTGVMTDLGTLGGSSSEAYDINDAGQVVGFAQDTGGARRAFLYESGIMRGLGALPGARASEAFGINSAGQVVGTSWVPDLGPQAVLWQGGARIDLNERIGVTNWKLQVARGINASGSIVGYGRLDGATRAFLLEPL